MFLPSAETGIFCQRASSSARKRFATPCQKKLGPRSSSLWDAGTCHPLKKRYHPRSTRSTKKSTRVKIAASHQRTQKLRWNQRTNPSKLNACCFFARQMTWCFAASRRYHRFSSRAPRFVAGGRAFTGFLLIGDYLNSEGLDFPKKSFDPGRKVKVNHSIIDLWDPPKNSDGTPNTEVRGNSNNLTGASEPKKKNNPPTCHGKILGGGFNPPERY